VVHLIPLRIKNQKACQQAHNLMQRAISRFIFNLSGNESDLSWSARFDAVRNL
jgi:hypothetical protein